MRSLALAHAPTHGDHRVAVERYKRRHYSKVEETRNELDERGWLSDAGAMR
jgi:hypothetical protein